MLKGFLRKNFGNIDRLRKIVFSWEDLQGHGLIIPLVYLATERMESTLLLMARSSWKPLVDVDLWLLPEYISYIFKFFTRPKYERYVHFYNTAMKIKYSIY